MSNHEGQPETDRGAKGIFASLSPKASFTIGLIGGIMLLCTIGFFILLTVYLQGGMDNTNNASKVAGAVANRNANTNVAVPTNTNTNTAPTKVNFTITDTDHIRGNKDASITILEYSDFQCPYCSNFHDSVKQIVEKYPDDVRWVYRYFPLDSIHTQARPAAIAAQCAFEQKGDDGFWDYSDKLYEQQSDLSTKGEELFTEIATTLGLNLDKFKECLDSEEIADTVEADYQSGLQVGVNGTPGSYLNGTALGGAVPFATLETQVKSLLNQ